MDKHRLKICGYTYVWDDIIGSVQICLQKHNDLLCAALHCRSDAIICCALRARDYDPFLGPRWRMTESRARLVCQSISNDVFDQVYQQSRRKGLRILVNLDFTSYENQQQYNMENGLQEIVCECPAKHEQMLWSGLVVDTIFLSILQSKA